MKSRTVSWLILGLLFLLVGCSKDKSSEQSQTGMTDMGIEQNHFAPTEEITEERSEEEANPTDTLIGEKVVTTIEMTYETLAYQDAVTNLKEVIEKHQAYVESSYESTNQANGYSENMQEAQMRQGNFIIRIPAEAVEGFLSDLSGVLGTKISEQVSNEDATQTYYDTQARIEVLQQKEERLRELLTQAATIEEILAIEDNLTETVAEREVLQSQNDRIDDLVDYSTLQLTILERTRVSNRPGSSLSFWERAREAIIDSAYTFYYWLQDAAIWLIYALPYLILLMLFGFIFWLVRKTNWWQKRRVKKRKPRRYFTKKKKEENQNHEK